MRLIGCLAPLHLFFQLCELLFEASGLRRARQRRRLPVCAIQLLQIARDALLDLPHSPLHFGAREILVPIIDCLELAAVDRDASFDEEAHGAAEHNKPAANLADSQAIVLAEIGDRLVIRNTTPSATSPLCCARPRAQAVGSTRPGSD